VRTGDGPLVDTYPPYVSSIYALRTPEARQNSKTGQCWNTKKRTKSRDTYVDVLEGRGSEQNSFRQSEMVNNKHSIAGGLQLVQRNDSLSSTNSLQ
jgi:hypothetical protein